MVKRTTKLAVVLASTVTAQVFPVVPAFSLVPQRIRRIFSAPARFDHRSTNTHSTQSLSNSQIESTTDRWIRKNVIGLNLCPFAERPIQTKRLAVHVVRGDSHDTIVQAVSTLLLKHKDEVGTALVVAPEYYPNDFERYMSIVQFLEQHVMEYHELHGHVQIALFHPQFTIDGRSHDDVQNFTNQSPYPMFHVLREDEVSNAVAKLKGDPGKVWRRNVRLLQNLEKKLGREGVVKIMKGKENVHDENGVDVTQAVVQKVLKQTHVEMGDGHGDEIKTRDVWTR